MVVWFVTIALLGRPLDRRRTRTCSAAFNPLHAVQLLRRTTAGTASSCSARCSWSSPAARRSTPTWGTSAAARSGSPGSRSCCPALLLNYFGQGALLLDDPEAAVNPFYLLAPRWALYPLVVLATMATVIASQALISGAFSLTRQAIQLGYCPRLDIEHTSRDRARADLHPAGQLGC